jgi:transposase
MHGGASFAPSIRRGDGGRRAAAALPAPGVAILIEARRPGQVHRPCQPRLEGAAMIPPGARVWIAMGHTDMRKGMQGLALLVQQAWGAILSAAICSCSGACRIAGQDHLARRHRHVALRQAAREGPLFWPSAKDGIVSLTASQLACLLDGIDWRNPQYSWRPQSAG